MAVNTTSILPAPISSIPGRLAPVFVTDKTVMTTTGTPFATTVPVKRLNRLSGATFTMATDVVEITELGTQYRVGGIDMLGEVKIKLDWYAVGINNMAALVSKQLSTTAGATNSVGLTDFQSTTFDVFALAADPKNNVFRTLYCQDCVIDDWTIDAKMKSAVAESVSASGPNAIMFPGWVLPKVLVAVSGDVTAGFLSPATTNIFGADEAPVQIPLPTFGQPPSYWNQNGANWFLKVEKVPGGVYTNVPVRYNEKINGVFQTAAAISSTAYITPSVYIPDLYTVGTKVQLELPGSANAEVVTITNVASQVSTTSTAPATAGASVVITPVSMLGIFPGVTVQLANADGTSAETQPVASVTSTTFTVATLSSNKTANFTIKTKAPSFQANVTKTHAAATVIYPFLAAAQNNVGNCTFVPTGAQTGKLFFGDAFVAGDAFRLVFCSYNSDSLPTTVPANAPDTTDRAAVSDRFIPIQINAATLNRVQSAQIKFSLKRDHVQGLGENTIVYGVPAVPDVAISFDLNENDLSTFSLLATGSKNLSALGGNISNDFADLNFLTRKELSTAFPVLINLFDPFSAGNVLCSYTTPQVVVKSVDISESDKGNNTVKITAMDIIGNLTISSTNAQ